MLTCPKCGSQDVMVAPPNNYVCPRCGHTWDIGSLDSGWIEEEAKVYRTWGELVDDALRSPDCETLARRVAELVGADERRARQIARRILREVMEELRLKGLGERALREIERC